MKHLRFYDWKIPLYINDRPIYILLKNMLRKGEINRDQSIINYTELIVVIIMSDFQRK